MLCEFPFAGRQLSLVSSLLLELARTSSVESDRPRVRAVVCCSFHSRALQLYETLYAFHVYRRHYTDAAAAMYEYAVRLRCEGGSVDDVARALAPALGALRLAPAGAQVVPTPPSASEHVLVVSLADMEREYALLRARAVLRSPSTPLEAAEAVTLLVAADRIAHALHLGRLCRVDLSGAFTALAGKLVRGHALLAADDEWADLEAGEKPDALLARLVRAHDSRHSNYAYARCVALVLLRERVELPRWLTQYLRERHPASLLQLLVSHTHYAAAQALVTSLLTDEPAAAAALPLPLVDVLLEHLDAGARALLRNRIQTAQ